MIKSFHKCPESNGYFRDPYNCQKFWQCENDIPYMQFCPDDLVFNDKHKICDYPSVTKCETITESEMKNSRKIINNAMSKGIFDFLSRIKFKVLKLDLSFNPNKKK